MAVHNSYIKKILKDTADLLDIKGANEFRVRAYRNAARTLGHLSKSVEEMIREGEDLTRLEGIGKDLAGKIKEIVNTGSLEKLEELKEELSPEMVRMLEVASLGPRRVKKLYDALGIKRLEELREAAQKQKIREIEGFGKKTEKKILAELQERGEIKEKRTLWKEAEEIAKALCHYLKKSKYIDQMEVAGSYRRCKETVGDLDILVSLEGENEQFMDHFAGYEEVAEVLSKGQTRSSVRLKSGIQVDLRTVEKKSFGSALLYFTGSKAHNIEIRKLALEKEYKISEYGIFQGETPLAGETEEGVYQKLGMPWIPPELRENQGEIEAARKNELPRLITWEDLQGDLHTHTIRTDGRNTIKEMVEASRELGYRYLAVTEHSKRVRMVNGLDERALEEQIEEIRELNSSLEGFRVLAGIEVDILYDGSLDLKNEVLEKCDLVVASVHYNREMSREAMTGRILKAVENPHVNIIAHPTGREINRRKAYELNLERVMEEAKEGGVFMELNGYPSRLDLKDIHCKMAKERGVKISLGSDAHSAEGLKFMKYGIGQARRGWLEREDVINTLSWGELKNILARR